MFVSDLSMWLMLILIPICVRKRVNLLGSYIQIIVMEYDSWHCLALLSLAVRQWQTTNDTWFKQGVKVE